MNDLIKLLNTCISLISRYEWALDNCLYKYNNPTDELKECSDTTDQLNQLIDNLSKVDPKLIQMLMENISYLENNNESE